MQGRITGMSAVLIERLSSRQCVLYLKLMQRFDNFQIQSFNVQYQTLTLFLEVEKKINAISMIDGNTLKCKETGENI